MEGSAVGTLPLQTVYGLFRRWQRDGTWTVLLTRLQGRADAAGLITWEVNVDSTCPAGHVTRYVVSMITVRLFRINVILYG